MIALSLVLVLGEGAPVAWVVESESYAKAVQAASSGWQIEWCGPNGSRCLKSPAASVRAVVGRADSLNLSTIPQLALVQSASWYPISARAVPPSATICNFDIWPDPWYKNYSVANIGEFAVAAIFEDTYSFAARSKTFVACAFSADAPSRCPSASTATNHRTVAALTIGVLGYGRIGVQVAQRMAALGADVIATKRSGPFAPAPPGLRWLSDNNDELLREADVVVVAVPGSTSGLINATALGLMKPRALLVPIAAGAVDFAALEAVLNARPALRAVLDVWPSGCWDDDEASCGPPYGPRDWPGSPAFASLPNVVALPGLAMRDARFWADSAALAGANLRALAAGQPVQHVVRNATHSGRSPTGAAWQTSFLSLE